MKIVLGTSSIWRIEMMRRLMRTRFPEANLQIVSPDIDEKAFRHTDPHILTAVLASRKNAAVQKRVAGPAVIVTFDQVIVCGHEIREKPASAEQAREFLRSYRTEPAVSVTAIMATNTATGLVKAGIQETTVWFRGYALSDSAIDALIEDGMIMKCAGGFAIGHKDFEERFILDRDGERESVMGFPKTLTAELITYAMEDR